MSLKRFLIIAGFLFSTTGQYVQADMLPSTTLATPTLWAKSPNMFTCSVTNISSMDRTIRIKIISQGNVLKDSGDVTLGSKHTQGLDIVGFQDGGYMYCEFTVEGRKTWYRGVGKMYHVDGDDFIAVPAY